MNSWAPVQQPRNEDATLYWNNNRSNQLVTSYIFQTWPAPAGNIKNKAGLKLIRKAKYFEWIIIHIIARINFLSLVIIWCPVLTTVSDKNSWDTLTKRCFFPSRAPLVPLKVVYRGLVTKSCTPTLRGQGDPKVSQPFWLRLCFWGILGMWLLVGSSGGKSLGRYMHVSEPFFREKH